MTSRIPQIHVALAVGALVAANAGIAAEKPPAPPASPAKAANAAPACPPIDKTATRKAAKETAAKQAAQAPAGRARSLRQDQSIPHNM